MHWLCCNINSFTRESLDLAFLNLTQTRAEHIGKMHHQQDRDRSLAAQLLLQTLLQQQGMPAMALHRKPDGQPFLEGSSLHVSLSHSEEMVACAISSTPVGIDIEKIRPIDLRICSRFFTPEEQLYVQGNEQDSDSSRYTRFFEIWTAKEAYFKRLGTGITDLRSVNVLQLQRQCHIVDNYMIHIL